MKKILKICVIVIIVPVLLAFLIVEIYFRRTSSYAVLGNSGRSIFDLSFVIDVNGVVYYTPKGPRLTAGKSTVYHNWYGNGRDIPIRINKYGFRGPDIEEKKADGEFRIIGLGDSITMQAYLDERETYLSLTQELLAKTHPEKKITMINGGIDGIGTQEEIDILGEQGLALAPDLVVIGWYPNDSRPPWGFKEEVDHLNVLRRHSIIAHLIMRNLEVKNVIKRAGVGRIDWINYAHGDEIYTDKDAFRKFADSAKIDWGYAWSDESWRITDGEFRRLKEMSDKHHFRVVVVMLPVIYQLYTNFGDDFIYKKMQDTAGKYGFSVIDVSPALRRELTTKSLFIDHAHLNQDGSTIVVNELSNFINSHNLIREVEQ